ncbi:procalin-like [Rhodnius prolixus]|uniref:procalin-like n=1 Tax=Rhodnius prolixus TaxID=13249 RepID=UPI003D1892CB
MMIIIAVTFLGLLGHSFAYDEISLVRGCYTLEDDHKKNLDTTKFFTGDWYLTHSTNPDNSSLCQKYEVRHDLHLTFNGKSGFVECEGAKLSGYKWFYSFNCTTKDKTFIRFMSVLETDYTKYALLYRCGLYGSETSARENFLIFNRNKDGGVPREIGNKLKEFGLWTFLFRKHGCKK